MKTIKKPKFLLTSIALLTILAAVSVGAVLGVFAVHSGYTFIICSGIGVIGMLAFNNAAVMILHIRFSDDL